MNWRALEKQIAAMTEAEKELPVLFRESYDDGAEIIEVETFIASNFLFPPEVDETDTSNAMIKPGERFLA